MKYLYSFLFFLIVMSTVYFWINASTSLVLAALLWAYMAINIWANDVANSVWPAVWSKTISLEWAIIIAAMWNILWAVLAWWEVVWTVKKKIIDISWFNDNVDMYIFAMIAALAWAALWLNIATYLRAPVSTTHSIVWWVMWAWIAALWFNIVSWWTMWKIAASWVISPVLGWIVAAIFLLSIKKTVIFKEDKITAAKKWVPIFISIMAWVFSTYLIIKWLKKTWLKLDFIEASLVWFIIAVFAYFIVRLYLKKTNNTKNTRESINNLFAIPLIFWVWLLTFAQWANDVANAIWPLAWIYDAVKNWWISWSVWIPLWVMLIWAFGIAVWLLLFWPRIIKTVWNEITELDKIRAFCIALASAITVIIASQLWLPVSSTHIAIGWIFWVGLLREWLDRKTRDKSVKYVKRDLVKKIIAAWLITVPAVATISWFVFLIINGVFG